MSVMQRSLSRTCARMRKCLRCGFETPLDRCCHPTVPGSAAPRLFYIYSLLIHIHSRTNITMLHSPTPPIGNLAMATALRAVRAGVQLPFAVHATYPSLNIDMSASPSRALSTIDLLLNTGVLKACLHAYVGDASRCVSVRVCMCLCVWVRVSGWALRACARLHRGRKLCVAMWQWVNGVRPICQRSYVVKNPCLTPSFDFLSTPKPVDSACRADLARIQRDISPWHAADEELRQLPPVYMSACEFDPLLDECVLFGRRLKSLGVDAHVRVNEACINM